MVIETNSLEQPSGDPEQREQQPSLRKGISWTFLGNVSNTISQFVLLMALARLGNLGMVGQYGLGLAVTAPVFLLANMSLRTVQVTDTEGYPFASFAALRFLSMSLGLGIVVLLCAGIGYEKQTTWIIFWVGVTKAVDGFSDVVFGEFQKNEKMDYIARSMIVKALITTAVFTAILSTTGSLAVSLISVSAVGFARFLFFDFAALLRMQHATPMSPIRAIGDLIKDIPTSKQLARIAWISLPVGFASFLVSLNTNIPRYFIDVSFGPEELGAFTVLSYPLAAGNIVMSAVAQTSLPRLHRYGDAQDSSRFKRLLYRMLLLAAGLGLIALLLAGVAGEELLRLIFGESYAQAHVAFLVLVMAMGLDFFNWCLNVALQSFRAFSRMMIFQVVATAVAVILSAWAIPTYGLEGASWVLVTTALVQILLKIPYVLFGIRSMVIR